jgi:TonB family protein
MAYKATVAILLFAWCASASAQEQTGKIIFYRESHFRNNDYKPPVFCDGVEIARMVSGSYLEVTAPPGRHNCVAESAHGPTTTIDIVPGSVAYLRVDIKPTVKRHAFLIPSTEVEYKHQKKLNAVATTHLSSTQPIESSTQTPPNPLANEEVQEAWLNGLRQRFDGPLQPKDSGERSANFGDLAVTTTNIETRVATYAPDRRQVSVFLAVNNIGKGVVCASFTAKLKTTFGFEYLGISGQAPRMREMLPGESAEGSYVFDVKNGVQPLELILDLDGGTVRCKTSVDAPIHEASDVNEIRLDVHDLPGLSADDPRSKGSIRPGIGVASHPSCLYCPDPWYTEKARHAKLEGTVQLKAVIGTDGKATHIEIVKGIGLGLDEQAVKAVQTWRFRPAVGPNGDPIATVVPIEITFRFLR